MIRIAALSFALMLAVSPAFAADPVGTGPGTGLGAAPPVTLSSGTTLTTGAGADVFGILIGMLRDAQREHREDRQAAKQLQQLSLSHRAQHANNNNDATDVGRREMEEKIRALMAQQDETERKLGKMEAALNKYRSLRTSAPTATTLKPGSVTRPSTTLAPMRAKKLELAPAGKKTALPPPDSATTSP